MLLAALGGLGCGLPIRSSHPDPAVDLLAEFPELAEWGSVVSIGGVEFWRPDLGRFDADPASWAPYADGYLYDDPIDGLVWVSEDPWGLITEHYGYWRHHDLYGFVWRPFFPPAWRPYVATIVRDDNGAILCWCPFSGEAWSLGLYVDGYGFDDGYWAPYGRVASVDPGFDDAWIGVTYYDPGTYSRDVPDLCYRRQRDYREHRRHQDPEPRGARGLEIVDELPAQRAEPPHAPRTEDRTPVTPPEANPGRGVSIDPVPREILLPKRRAQEPPPTRLPAQPRPAPAVPSDRPRNEPVTPTLPAAPASSLTPARRAPATPSATPPRPIPEPAPAPSFTPAYRAPALPRESPARPEPTPAPAPSPAQAPSFTPMFQAPATPRAAPAPETVPASAPPIAPIAPAPPPAAPDALPAPPPAPVTSSPPAAAAPAPRALEIRPAAVETVRPAAPSSRAEGVRRIDAPKAGRNDVP